MATARTEWHEATPNQVKRLIARFYELIESKAEDVGPVLASEVFTPTGIMQAGEQKFEGTERKLPLFMWHHV